MSAAVTWPDARTCSTSCGMISIVSLMMPGPSMYIRLGQRHLVRGLSTPSPERAPPVLTKSVSAALRRVTARTVVAGVDSDRLYPLYQQAEIAHGIPGGEQLRVISSPHGHDAFLIEADQIAKLLGELLAG